MFSQNSKMKKSSNSQYTVYNWTLPAVITCPAAGKCKKGCYATQGAYSWSNVSDAHHTNWALTKTADFVPRAIAELKRLSNNAAKRGKKVILRIHDAGDFYSAKYLNDWKIIMLAVPEVYFYAYTKQVKLFQATDFPTNFRYIFSEGGIFDNLIDAGTEYHSRVFPDSDSLKAAGYTDASNDDLVAALGISNKIGLIYHGAKSKAWKTGAENVA
jgi:hypothetical protein